jgi:hypothetical protein
MNYGNSHYRAWLRYALCVISVGLSLSVNAYTVTAPALGSFVITNCHDTNFLLKFGLNPPAATASKYGTNTFYSYRPATSYAAYLQSTLSPVQPVTTFTAYLVPADSILTNHYFSSVDISDTNLCTNGVSAGWNFYVYSNVWQFAGQLIPQSGYWVLNPYGGTWTLFPVIGGGYNGAYSEPSPVPYTLPVVTNTFPLNQWWPYNNLGWAMKSTNQIDISPAYPVQFSVGLGSNLDLSQSIHFRVVTQIQPILVYTGYATNETPYEGLLVLSSSAFPYPSTIYTNDYYAQPLDVILKAVDYCGTTPVFYNPPFANANAFGSFVEESNTPPAITYTNTPKISAFTIAGTNVTIVGYNGTAGLSYHTQSIGDLTQTNWDSFPSGTFSTNFYFTSSIPFIPYGGIFVTSIIPVGSISSNDITTPPPGLPGTNDVYTFTTNTVQSTNVTRSTIYGFYRISIP